MSDYFRFYDDGLDEPRLQYAINRNPSIISVWVWVLCQCAKKKSDTIDPVCNATLLGVAHKLGIGAGVFNECLSLLEEIHYVEKDVEGNLTVRKWNKLQSEYVRKYHDSIRTVSGEQEKGIYSPLLSSLNKNDGFSGEIEHDSEIIYGAYPKKVGKPFALKAIRKSLRKSNPSELLEKVKKYAESVSEMDRKYIPHPATWFNQERYNDDPSTWNTGSTQEKKEDSYDEVGI